MGGLAILFVVGLYLAIGLWIVIKSPGWWRLVALLAVILVPTADALWGRHVTLPRLCKDAGLQVFAKASKQDGLMMEGPPDESFVSKYDFPFVEGRDATGKYYRFSKAEGQERAISERNVRPSARYLVSLDTLRPTGSVTGAALRVRDLTTGAVAGQIVEFGFDGGWAERLISSFSDAGPGPIVRSGCDVGDFSYDRLFVAVFEPGGAR